MAKKRSIEEVETSNQSDVLQSKKKKAKKVWKGWGVSVLSLYIVNENMQRFVSRENGPTNNACLCFAHVVLHTGKTQDFIP